MFDCWPIGCFLAFEKLHLGRQVITVVTEASRNNDKHFNLVVSLEKTIKNEDRFRTLVDDVLPTRGCDHPEMMCDFVELIGYLRQDYLNYFSAFEIILIALRTRGHTYAQMGRIVGVSEKSVANGLFRVRKKLKQIPNY